jgi:RHS repeat-associated protein
MMLMRILLLALTVLAIITPLAAMDAPPPGQARYLVTLWEPGTPIPGHPELHMKRVPEPDFAKLGGKLLHARNNKRLIHLPPVRLQELRRHEAVSSVQRIWTGESLDRWSEGENNAGALSGFDELTAETDTGALTWGPKEYFYDGSGNITKIDEDVYTYDTAGRLISAKVNGETESYKYDAFGNLTERGLTSRPPVIVGVDSASNRLAGREYDAAGNVVRDGHARYAYDALNRLSSYSRASTHASSSTERRFIYDADDEQLGIVKNETSSWTIRDFAGQTIREFNGEDMGLTMLWRWEADYIRGEGQLLRGETPQWTYNGVTQFTYGGTRHYHLDHLGSVRVVTNDAGRSISEHDYYPFGSNQTRNYQEPIHWGHPSLDGMRFAGHARDFLDNNPEVENHDYLDNMHARYYDPNVGRFLSVDPVMNVETALREPQSWNRYSYVTNNPLKYTDPDGREKTIYFFGGLLHRWTAYEEVSDLRGFVKSQAGYSLSVDSQMSRAEVLGGLGDLDSTDIAVLNAHSWDLNLQTERGATGRETFIASSIVSAFKQGGDPQALVLASCRSADIAQFVANKTGVVTFGTTARAQSREVGFAATVLATIYAKTGNAAQAVKVANSILQKGACPRDNPGCTPERPTFVYYEPEKKK